MVDAARGILHFLWVRASTARIRQLLRVDKVQFFVALAHQAQVAAENNDQRTLYACVRRLRKQKPIPAAVLKSDDGELIITQEERVRAQSAFACRRHAAEATSVEDLQLRAHLAAQSYCDTPLIAAALPSPVEIRGIFAKVQHFKAHGTDLIPPDLLRRCSGPLTRICSTLFLKAAVWFYEPVAWRGGAACFFPKPKAKAGNASFDSLREIVLSSVLGKA